MNQDQFKKLHTEGFISDASFQKIAQRRADALFSVYWEVKTLLYLGIVLLTGGLGILVYKNIDTIGHQAILAFIAAIILGCFFYCFKHKPRFSTGKVAAPKAFFDYLLLLGTLSFLIFIGYLQYQYNVFGSHYGMATFIPMLALFYIAYDFDHMGILTLAITNLALWMGVSVTPKQLLLEHTFDSATAIYTYLGLGLLLLILALITQKANFKQHFKFSYQHYGLHLSFITLLAGYFFFWSNTLSILWLLGLFVLAGIIFKDAYRQRSFYFLLLVVLYSYVAISTLIVRGLVSAGAIYFIMMYFILSGAGLVYLLIFLNKQLKEA